MNFPILILYTMTKGGHEYSQLDLHEHLQFYKNINLSTFKLMTLLLLLGETGWKCSHIRPIRMLDKQLPLWKKKKILNVWIQCTMCSVKDKLLTGQTSIKIRGATERRDLISNTQSVMVGNWITDKPANTFEAHPLFCSFLYIF